MLFRNTWCKSIKNIFSVSWGLECWLLKTQFVTIGSFLLVSSTGQNTKDNSWGGIDGLWESLSIEPLASLIFRTNRINEFGPNISSFYCSIYKGYIHTIVNGLWVRWSIYLRLMSSVDEPLASWRGWQNLLVPSHYCWKSKAYGFISVRLPVAIMRCLMTVCWIIVFNVFTQYPVIVSTCYSKLKVSILLDLK